MKRSISLFLTLAMLFSFCSLFASCGGNEGEGTTAETGEETTAETTVPSSYDVTFSVGGVETIVTVAPGETPVYPGEASWETSEHY